MDGSGSSGSSGVIEESRMEWMTGDEDKDDEDGDRDERERGEAKELYSNERSENDESISSCRKKTGDGDDERAGRTVVGEMVGSGGNDEEAR